MRIQLIDEDRPLLAAVATQIPLTIAVEIEFAGHYRSGYRFFPDAGMHGAPLPGDVLGQPDIDRDERVGHLGPSFAGGPC